MALSFQLSRKAQIILFVILGLTASLIAGGAVWYLNQRDSQVAPDDSAAAEDPTWENTCSELHSDTPGVTCADDGPYYCEEGQGQTCHWKQRCRCTESNGDIFYEWIDSGEYCVDDPDASCPPIGSDTCTEQQCQTAGDGSGPDEEDDSGVYCFCDNFECSDTGGGCSFRCDDNCVSFSGQTAGCGFDPREEEDQDVPLGCFDRQIDYYPSGGYTLCHANLSGAECEPDQDICGDGDLDPGEQCDDGNTTNGDGCDNNCQTETTDTSCSVTHGFQCLDDGQVRVNWDVTAEGFNLGPNAGRVVVRIDNLGDPWFTTGSDTWWSTHFSQFIEAGLDPDQASWDFDIVPGDDYSVRVAVDADPDNATVEGTCSTGSPTFSCEGNDAPSCNALTASSSTIQNGEVVTLTASTVDQDDNVDEVVFYWALSQDSGDYCGSVDWNEIGNGTNSSGNNWTYQWNVSGIPNDGTIVVVANVFDDEGAWCTGNPSGSCSTTAQACTECGVTLGIEQPVCESLQVEGEVMNGSTVEITVNVSDEGGDITDIPLYWVSATDPDVDYCSNDDWGVITANATQVDNSTWVYEWDISGIPTEGSIYIFSDLLGTQRNMFCTGNPGGVCSTGAPSCPTCSELVDITIPACGDSCSSDLECGDGMECSSGLCRNPSCPTDTDCTCTTTTENECGDSCTSNDQCDGNMLCIGGICANPNCSSDTDCVCDDEPECSDSCDSNSDCSSGHMCINGMCRNPSCSEETDCVCTGTVPNTGAFDSTRNKLIGGFVLICLSLAYMLSDGFDRVILVYTSKEYRLRDRKERFEEKISNKDEE